MRRQASQTRSVGPPAGAPSFADTGHDVTQKDPKAMFDEPIVAVAASNPGIGR